MPFVLEKRIKHKGTREDTKNTKIGFDFMSRRRSIFSEFFLFVLEHKAYWMTPIIIAILLLAGIIVLGALGGGAAAPFIYTLF